MSLLLRFFLPAEFAEIFAESGRLCSSRRSSACIFSAPSTVWFLNGEFRGERRSFFFSASAAWFLTPEFGGGFRREPQSFFFSACIFPAPLRFGFLTTVFCYSNLIFNTPEVITVGYIGIHDIQHIRSIIKFHYVNHASDFVFIITSS